MLVAHEQTIDAPFDAVVARLEQIFPVLDRMASGAFTNERLAEVKIGPNAGEGLLAKQVRLRWSVPIVDDERWMVSLAWSATHTIAIFPRMDADLSAIAAGTETIIRFRGNYEPPLGPIGEALDRAAFHRIAEGTVENFVARVVELIERRRDQPPS